MDITSVANAVNQAVIAAQATDGAANAAAVATETNGPGLALGLAVLGAGIGIGKLAAAALEGSARQPESAGQLQGMMILAIAFIEALALFGAFVI